MFTFRVKAQLNGPFLQHDVFFLGTFYSNAYGDWYILGSTNCMGFGFRLTNSLWKESCGYLLIKKLICW